MAKLKNIIKQLTEKDYNAIYHALIDSNADKSAYLLQAIREKGYSDNAIMEKLEVNTNAYYTLRSRLNQKIEEHLLEQMENPRTDVLKKVANINEILFTKKSAITIATLKKLEKELIDYDLSNELTIVYKSLKKLHIHSPDYFQYSQLYNKHVAYMLAVDKAEELLADYFKKYGEYVLTGDEVQKLALDLLRKEMDSVGNLYESHRMFVYQSCLDIFHRLFMINEKEDLQSDEEPIEDVLAKVEKILHSFGLDTTYYHLGLVFEYLKLEYYNHYSVYKKAEKYYEEVNDAVDTLLSNYSLYTFPARFLISKIERALRLGTESALEEENKLVFQDFECDDQDLPKYTYYILYRSICCYYSDEYEKGARWINNFLNTVSMKNYPYAQMEVKTILALQYCCMRDYDLFQQLISSIQRQIRIIGKENCEHIVLLCKMMKISISDVKRNKKTKIQELMNKFLLSGKDNFSPTLLIKMDENFLRRMV